MSVTPNRVGIPCSRRRRMNRPMSPRLRARWPPVPSGHRRATSLLLDPPLLEVGEATESEGTRGETLHSLVDEQQRITGEAEVVGLVVIQLLVEVLVGGLTLVGAAQRATVLKGLVHRRVL